MKSIILKISEYKEKDAIINAINENGIITFIAKGVRGAKSKCLALNNPLSIVDLNFVDNPKYKYPVLKDADVLYSPLNLMGNLKELGLVMLLSDLINNMLQDEEKLVVFQYILSSLEDIYKNKRVNENILFLIFKFLNTTGFSFSVSSCVGCNSKNDIVNFSLNEGGFLCRKCNNKERIIASGNDLLKIRAIISSNDNKFNFEPLEDNVFDSILKETILFIEDNFGLNIKNKEILL